MFRYVAFAWNDADPVAQDGSRTLAERLQSGPAVWRSVLASRGLQVFCTDIRAGSSEAYLLEGGTGTGVVVGKLFATSGDGSSSSVPLNLSEGESSAILTSAGRRLVERYWGRYVAFLQDPAAGTAWVLRDPTGVLPCFNTRLLGVDVFFSHMAEAAQLGGRAAFSVNWKYASAVICQLRVQVHATGLNEVSQVLGGECVELRRGVTSRRFYWNLLDIAQSDPIDDAVDAARQLRAQTRDCVHAWASAYPGIVHMLSGGLDSSIVFACLNDAPSHPRMTCLNLHAPGSNSDERSYARLAVSGTSLEVLERPRKVDSTLRAMLDVQPSCMPGDVFSYLDGGRLESQLAAEQGATAIFTGYGGDQLFYQSRARYAAGEFLAARGLSPTVFTVALDAARVDRLSVWSVLHEAAVHSLLRRRWSMASEAGLHQSLVRDGLARDISRDSGLIHPWFRGPAGSVSSGKLWHAHQLLFPADFYNPLGADSDPEMVAPLYSQPLMALAMRLPTWLQSLGGWDRALARRAFQHDLPRGIVARRTKGGREEHAKSIFVRDIGFAREMLLDGNLVREQILDRVQVSDALSGRPTRKPTGNAELFGSLSVEVWSRQWHSTESEAVK